MAYLLKLKVVPKLCHRNLCVPIEPEMKLQAHEGARLRSVETMVESAGILRDVLGKNTKSRLSPIRIRNDHTLVSHYVLLDPIQSVNSSRDHEGRSVGL